MNLTYLNPAHTPMREELGPFRFRAERLIKATDNYSIFKRGSFYDVVCNGALVHQGKTLADAENYCTLPKSSTAA